MALPAPAPPAPVPGNWQGQAGGRLWPHCTTSPSWLGCWAFPRVPSEPCRSFLGTLGASGDRDATQSSAPECCPQRYREWGPGAQLHAASACTPARAAPFLSQFEWTDSSAFCAHVCCRRKWELSPSSGSVSGEFVPAGCRWVGWGVGGGPAVRHSGPESMSEGMSRVPPLVSTPRTCTAPEA